MDIQTPNGFEFSAAAKCYMCAGRLIAPGGGAYFGVLTPQGTKVDFRSWAKGLVLVTIESLTASGHLQVWPADKKVLIGSVPSLGVRALASEAPGFSGRFLKATHWSDTYLVDLLARLVPSDESPLVALLGRVAHEFEQAGVYTPGGYGGHGDVWNTEWLTYLQDAWYPEAYELWQRAWARPDREAITRSLMFVVAGSVQHDDDGFDD